MSPNQRVSEYTSTFRIAFSDTDAAGVAHFSLYFRLMEDTEHALYRMLGTKAFSAGPSESTGLPRVHASCDFMAPLHFEDEVDVCLRVSKISTRSLHYDFAFTRGKGASRTAIAQGHMKVVYAARTAGSGGFESRPVPPELAEKLIAWQPNERR